MVDIRGEFMYALARQLQNARLKNQAPTPYDSLESKVLRITVNTTDISFTRCSGVVTNIRKNQDDQQQSSKKSSPR